MAQVFDKLPEGKKVLRGRPRKYLNEEILQLCKDNPGKPVLLTEEFVDKRYLSRLESQALELDVNLVIHFVFRERRESGKSYSYLGEFYASYGELSN